MKEPHVLRVEAPPATFAALAGSLAAAGLRLGWLELTSAPPAPLPPGLAAAAELGVLRAVAVGPGLALAAKPRRGAPVLRDLLREHFLGCRLVLAGGPEAPVDLPLLTPGPEGGWRVTPAGGAALRLSGAELAGRLRRPRPWGEPPPAPAPPGGGDGV